jgi:hypothetical protein
MRYREWWALRILIAASFTLNLAFIDHDVFHRSFLGSLLEGLGIFGILLLPRYLDDAAQQRRTRTQQQPLKVEERVPPAARAAGRPYDPDPASGGRAFPITGVVPHPGHVGELYPMPSLGDIFADVRDNGRTMRISCHTDRGAVVVSLWHDTLCRGSFRLAADDLERFISTLAEMSTALRSAPTPTAERVGNPGPGGPASDSAAALAQVPDPAQPPFEQTGDVTGTAGFGRLPFTPVPRVA